MSNTSDLTCRILVISANIQDAASFVRLLQELKGGKAAALHDNSQVNEIPWVIQNRYYSATVHFKLHPIIEEGDIERSTPSPQYEGVPAVIWVWRDGQVYREHVERLQKEMEGCGAEPEVCLGVRLPSTDGDAEAVPGSSDEDAEVDTFLSSNGLEYVNAINQNTPTADPGAYSDAIPGLPRVLDALGTIMWPSMEPVPKGAETKSPGKQTRERALLHWAHTSQGVITEEEDPYDQPTSGNALKREMSELQRWLEESDDHMRDDPWRSATSTAGALSGSPTAIDFSDALDKATPKGETENKFDDDFTVFISAPPVDASNKGEDNGTSGRSTPDLARGESLGVPGGRGLYRSLGSVSDFGESDGPSDLDDNEEEEGLPTRQEIREASRKIFGQSKGSASNREAKGVDAISTESQEDYEMAPFDLTRVLGTLQEMKAEIALIEDEDERRKAAAKVALGLVYGLEDE